MYAASVSQELDNLYPVTNFLRQYLDACLHLFEVGPDGCNICPPGIEGGQNRNSVAVLLGQDGPATIPGATPMLKGPIGLSLYLLSEELMTTTFFQCPTWAHETGHGILESTQLKKGYAAKIAKRLLANGKAGQYKFIDEFVSMGEQKVPTLMWLIMVILQELPEIAPDCNLGGVAQSGPAFVKACLPLFVAYNSRQKGVLATSQGLRSNSTLEIVQLPDGKIVARTETHMPDWPRAFACWSLTLAEFGFKDDADTCRKLALQANRFEAPEFLEWVNRERGITVRLPAADYDLVLPDVVDILVNEQMDELGGLCAKDILNWTPKRQEKVLELVKMLFVLFRTNKIEIPASLENRDVNPNYLGAALAEFYWQAVSDGFASAQIIERLCEPKPEFGGQVPLVYLMQLFAERQKKLDAEKEAMCAADKASCPNPDTGEDLEPGEDLDPGEDLEPGK
jgi:hypothetical protein